MQPELPCDLAARRWCPGRGLHKDAPGTEACCRVCALAAFLHLHLGRALFGVATNDAALSADVALDLTGVFELTKIGSQAWTVGALVYWDDTNKRCTTVATDNTLIGVAVEAVASGAGDTIGRVRLNATF